MKRNCFCCKKEIHPCRFSDDDSFDGPPSDATFWRTIGNYGSTVFDGGEYTNEKLELYICDPCLIERADMVYHFKQVNRGFENVNVKPFGELLSTTPTTKGDDERE